MSKNKTIQKIIKYGPYYFIILAILSLVISLYALRDNYKHMVSLRNNVYTADTNNYDISGSLQRLQAFVTSHMNTDLAINNSSVYPPIQLQHTYDRLVSQAQLSTANNSQLYTDAQNYCQAQIPTGVSGRYRISCIESYVSSHTTAQAPHIPDGLYKFDFLSPRWSPDLAGWSLVLTLVFAIAFLTLIVIRRIVKS